MLVPQQSHCPPTWEFSPHAGTINLARFIFSWSCTSSWFRMDRSLNHRAVPHCQGRGGGGYPCLGKYESTSSRTTKSGPLLKNERTNYVWFPKIARETVDSCYCFLVDSGWLLSCVSALLRLYWDTGKVIIILWHGTSGQRHSLTYTCASP